MANLLPRPSRHFMSILRREYTTMKMKPTFRYDSRPWTPPEGARYTTPEDAARIMLDAPDGAEAARLRMLERQQCHGRSESAAAARLNMIRRQDRGT